MTIVSVFIALLSFLIACLALTFTIGSFWWLNARQGRLTSFEPHSFATWASQSSPYETRVRFPLVLYNTGANRSLSRICGFGCRKLGLWPYLGLRPDLS
jgi:hypothetical protein